MMPTSEVPAAAKERTVRAPIPEPAPVIRIVLCWADRVGLVGWIEE